MPLDIVPAVASTPPSGSGVAVAYQRCTAICALAVHGFAGDATPGRQAGSSVYTSRQGESGIQPPPTMSMRPSGNVACPVQNRSVCNSFGCGSAMSDERVLTVVGVIKLVSPGKNRQKRIVWLVPDSPNMNTFVASVPGSRSTTVCVEEKPRLGEATQRPVWLSGAAITG